MKRKNIIGTVIIILELLLLNNNIFCQEEQIVNGDPMVTQYRINRGDGDPNYTGTINFDKLLMTVPGRGGLDYNINLQYVFGNGVPAGEAGSWIGLGWNLNMYQITCSPIEYTQTSTVSSMKPIKNDHFYLSYPGGSTEIYNFSDQGEDWRPLNWSNIKIYAERDANVSIPYNIREYKKFIITDAEGTQYVYDVRLMTDRELCTLVNHFETVLSELYKFYRCAYVFKLSEIKRANYVDANSNGVADSYDLGDWIKLHYSTIEGDLDAGYKKQVNYLSKIETPLFYADFYSDSYSTYIERYSSWPTSLKNLTSIKLYRKNNNSITDGNLIKTVSFNSTNSFSWIRNVGGGGYQLVLEGTQRLRLNSIKISGENGVELPTYKFDYYDGPPFGQSELGVINYTIDPWGYVNYYITSQSNPIPPTTYGANHPYWMLKKVTYPTGGSVSFEYESNKFISPTYTGNDLLIVKEGGGVRLLKKNIVEADTNKKYTYIYEYSKGTSYPDAGIISCPPPGDMLGVRARGGVTDWSVEYPEVKTILPDNSEIIKYYTSSFLGSLLNGSSSYFKSFETVTCASDNDLYPTLAQWNNSGSENRYKGMGSYETFISMLKSYNDVNLLYSEPDGSGHSGYTHHVFDNKWKRGYLTREEHVSATHTPVKTKLYYYTMLPRRSIPFDLFEIHIINGTSLYPYPGTTTSGWARLDKEETIQYDQNGSNSVASIVQNNYNDLTGMIDQTIETNSDNKQRVTGITYAWQKYDAMYSNHMFSQIAQKTIYVGQNNTITNPLSSEVTTWKAWNNCWMPEKTYSWIEDDGTGVYSLPAFDFTNWSGTGEPQSTDEWLRTSKIASRDACGNILESSDANGIVTSTTWPADYNYALPVATTINGQLISTKSYNTRLQLLSETDANSKTVYSGYDGLGRLSYIKDNQNNSIKDYAYFNSREINDVFVESNPNYVQERLYRSGSDYTTLKKYSNSLGNIIQQQMFYGNQDIISSSTVYDVMQRPEKIYMPYQYSSSHAYDASFSANAASYNTSAGSYPFTQNKYLTDPLDRVEKIAFPGESFHLGSGKEIKYGYLISDNMIKNSTTSESDKITDNYLDLFGNNVKSVVDPNGLALTTTFEYNVLGNLLKATPPNGSNYATTYIYNTLGQLIQKSSPDAGTVQYLYDKVGNLRFIKDANHSGSANSYSSGAQTVTGITTITGNSFALSMPAVVSLNAQLTNTTGTITLKIKNKSRNSTSLESVIANTSNTSAVKTIRLPKGEYYYEVITTGTDASQFSYSVNVAYNLEFVYKKYNEFNQVTEEGEYQAMSAGNFTAGNASNPGFPSSGQYLTAKYSYGQQVIDPLLTSLSLSQSNLIGRLSSSESYNSNTLTETKFYSYNDKGNVEWLLNKLPDNSYTKFDYTYDLQGNLTVEHISGSSASANLYKFYEYDQLGRLADVYATTGSTKTDNDKIAHYTYFADGSVKRLELGRTVQGIDYVYNPRGWLTQINHQNISSVGDPGEDGSATSSFTKDKFGMVIGYNNLDGIGTAQNVSPQFDGNLSWLMYQIEGASNNGSLVGWTYNYDNASRLTKADYGAWSGSTNSWQTTDSYDMNTLNYDNVGNITALTRNGSGGSTEDDLTYGYMANSNKLDYVTGTGTGFFVGDRAYTTIPSTQSPLLIKGNVSLKPGFQSGLNQKVYIGPNIEVNYAYDDNGNMIKDITNGIVYILYNTQNLPVRVYSADGSVMNYTYDIGGNRISNRWDSGSYGYNYVYGATGKTEMRTYIANGSAEEVIHNLWGNDLLGTYNIAGATVTKTYFLKDHIGSIKVKVMVNGANTIVATDYDDYDPFGAIMNGRSSFTGLGERYKFTGKERDAETNYDYFGARYYDSRIARWLQVDPLAEKYAGWSPFNYVADNPVKHFDPDGKGIKEFWQKALNSIQFSFSAGFGFKLKSEFAGYGVKAGFNLYSKSLVSGDFAGSLKYNDGTISKGSFLEIGKTGFSTEETIKTNTETQTNGKYITMHETTTTTNTNTVSFLGLGVGTVKETTTDTNKLTGEIKKKTERKMIGNASDMVNISLQFILGFDITIDMQKLYQASKELGK